LIRNYIDAQIERLRALGYDVDSCLVDLGETAEAVAAEALRSKHFDCVVIGAGLREPPQRLHLLQHHARRHRRGRAALGRALSPRVPVCPGIVKFTLAGFDIASLIGT
jgi:hypothetical protein